MEDYLSYKYWEYELLSRGFEKNIGFSIDWIFPWNDLYGVWNYFIKDNFVAAFRFNTLKYPTDSLEFQFIYRPGSPDYILTEVPLDYSNKNQILQFIEACSDTSKMPLCIPDKWASSIVEACLNRV